MNFLLDTCAISETIKQNPNKHALARIKGLKEESCFLSVLTFGEIQAGLVKIPDSKRKTILQHWFEVVLPNDFQGRVLAVTKEVALMWGKIQGEAQAMGKPIPVIDSLLASTALVHQLAVVTRNWRHMKSSGVQILDPWA